MSPGPSRGWPPAPLRPGLHTHPTAGPRGDTPALQGQAGRPPSPPPLPGLEGAPCGDTTTAAGPAGAAGTRPARRAAHVPAAPAPPPAPSAAAMLPLRPASASPRRASWGPGGRRAAGRDGRRDERGGGSRRLGPARPQEENNKLPQHGRRLAAAAVHAGRTAAGRRGAGPPLGGRGAPSLLFRGRERHGRADGRGPRSDLQTPTCKAGAGGRLPTVLWSSALS